MKIKKIFFKEFNLKLSNPFGYFTATLEYLPYILVKIETDNGLVGLGEAAIAWDVTGETQEGALGLQKYIDPLLINHDLNSVEDIKELVAKVNINVYKNNALKSGIEFALLDALGKDKGKPIYELLGGKYKDSVLAQRVFPFKEKHSDDLKEKIELSLKSGAKIIKFKAGDDFEKDYAVIEKVVAWFPEIKIVLDINQGWTDAEKALPLILKLEKFKNNINWIEQPILASDFEGLAELSAQTQIPIMADESCHDLLDLKNLHLNKSVNLINIKLAKTGGLLAAIEMVNYCEAHNIKYMLGDMIVSSLGTAANLHMSTLGNFISFDLTPVGELSHDPFTGLKVKDYLFSIPQNHGLGVE